VRATETRWLANASLPNGDGPYRLGCCRPAKWRPGSRLTCGGYPDARGFISTQLIAQTAKGDAQDSCGVSPIAAAGGERENDVLSYHLGERCVIFRDRHDPASC
jgi:hypothetical protein